MVDNINRIFRFLFLENVLVGESKQTHKITSNMQYYDDIDYKKFCEI
jgi:hypothetical protein